MQTASFVSKFLVVGLLVGFFVTSQALANPLEGKWAIDCDSVEGLEFAFENDRQGKVSALWYTDKSCGSLEMTYVVDFEYQIGSASSRVPGATEISYVFKREIATPLTQKYADEQNFYKDCGKTDWKLNTPKDITGLKCARFGFGKNQKSYDLFSVKDGIFQIGSYDDDHDASSPAKRPVALSDDFLFKKK